MLLKYFYNKRLAQASYMVGCSATGEAMIIDAGRDIQPYIDAAAEEKLSITHLTETHIHADYVSGNRELAAATGARMFLSDMGDDDWKYQFAEKDNAILVHDSDMWMVGNIKVEVIHTPGHTPEHLTFMITDTAAADEPIALFTGDFLFAGNIGRPDLLEEAAGIAGTREAGARQQYHNIQRFKDMPDYLQVLPGHGAGSACGKGLGSIPSSTLGYEKRFNPAFQIEDEDDFVNWLLDGQPEAPKYFARMKKVNKEGPILLSEAVSPEQMTAAQFADLVADNAQIIDTRSATQTGDSYIPGVMTVPASHTSFSTYAGWYIDFERPLYLVAAPRDVDSAVMHLREVGVDNIPGFIDPADLEASDSIPQISPETLSERMQQNGLVLIDVRGRGEHADERISGAVNIPMGYIQKHLNEIPRNKPIITQCASGNRSQVVASILKMNGYNDVSNLTGGITAWQQAGLAVERD